MTRLKNWLPALVMMAIIFTASSIPSSEMPNFDRFDFSVKKLGHSIGYALLAVSYLRGLKSSNHNPQRAGAGGHKEHKGGSVSILVSFVFNHLAIFAWSLAIFFAGTDEFHQSFTPGRNPSIWDILIYDNLGAIIGLWIIDRFDKSKQKDDAPAPSSPTTNS
jgi:VanZ family protein